MDEVVHLSRTPSLSELSSQVFDITRAKRVILGQRVARSDGGGFELSSIVSHHSVVLASDANPALERLEVNTSSSKTISAISRFRHLRHLSIMLARRGRLLGEFNPPVVELLESIDGLEELSLTNFHDVNLLVIAETCGQSLNSVSLNHCNLTNHELPPNTLPKLEKLKLAATLDIAVFGSLLTAGPNLRELELLCDEIFVALVKVFVPDGRLGKLELLTVVMDVPFSEAGVDDDCLRKLFTSLPALRHLITDSEELRAFFKKETTDVRVSGSKCNVCAVEFENMCERIKESVVRRVTDE